MKRILLLLIVLLSILSTKAQTPSGKTPIGSATLTQWNKGVQLADSGFQFTNFPDTFHLNLGWLKGIPNLLALVNDTFYVRNPLMTAWVKVGGSGGSGSALTLQNVITNGNVLTQNDTININSHFLSFLNGKVGIGSTGSPDLLSLSAANLASMSLKQSLTGQVFKIRIGDGTTSPVSQSFQIFDSSANKILLSASGDQFGIGNIPKGQYSTDSKVEVFGGANGANIDAKGDSTIVDQSTFEAENAEYDNSNQQSISIREYGNLFPYADTIMGFPKKATGVLDYLGNNYAIINVENNIPLRIGTNDSERIDITGSGQIKFIKQPLNETGTYKYLTIDAADSTVKQVSVSVPNLQSVTSAGNITTIPIQINGTSPFASQYVYLAPNEINFASIHGTTIYSLESYNNNENGTTNVSFMPNDPLGGSGNFLATSVNGHFANDSGQITVPIGSDTTIKAGVGLSQSITGKVKTLSLTNTSTQLTNTSGLIIGSGGNLTLGSNTNIGVDSTQYATRSKVLIDSVALQTQINTNTNAIALKKNISDSLLTEGYTTRYKAQQDSIVAASKAVGTDTTIIAGSGLSQSLSGKIKTLKVDSTLFATKSFVTQQDTTINAGTYLTQSYSGGIKSINADTTKLATQTQLATKQNTLTLTTTGTSGAATLTGATLNIPQYSGGGSAQTLQQVFNQEIGGSVLTKPDTIIQGANKLSINGGIVKVDSFTVGVSPSTIGVLIDQSFPGSSIPATMSQGSALAVTYSNKAIVTGASFWGAPSNTALTTPWASALQINNLYMPYERMSLSFIIVPQTKSTGAIFAITKGSTGNSGGIVGSNRGTIAFDMSGSYTSLRAKVGKDSITSFTSLPSDSTVRSAFSTGDSLLFTIGITSRDVSITILDKTTGAITKQTFATQNFSCSGGRWNFAFLNGTFHLLNIKMSSSCKKGVPLFIGDSQIYGAGVSAENKRAANLAFKSNYKYYNCVGLPSATGNIAFPTILDEVIAALQPNYVIEAFGYNDETDGIGASTWGIDLDTCRLKTIRGGAIPIFMGIDPKLNITTHVYDDTTASRALQYGILFIPTRTVLCNGGTSAYVGYLSSDLIHFNDIGNSIINSQIISTGGNTLLTNYAKDSLNKINIIEPRSVAAEDMVNIIGTSLSGDLVQTPYNLTANYIENRYNTNTTPPKTIAQPLSYIHTSDGYATDGIFQSYNSTGLIINYNNNNGGNDSASNIQIYNGGNGGPGNTPTNRTITGFHNEFIGSAAKATALSTVTGSGNIGLGYGGGASITSGSRNFEARLNSSTYVGTTLTTGNDNIIITAAQNALTGSNNYIIGGGVVLSDASNRALFGQMYSGANESLLANECIISPGLNSSQTFYFGGKTRALSGGIMKIKVPTAVFATFGNNMNFEGGQAASAGFAPGTINFSTTSGSSFTTYVNRWSIDTILIAGAGLLLDRITTTAINAIATPPKGLMFLDTSIAVPTEKIALGTGTGNFVRSVLTNDATPSNGKIPIGNGVNYTLGNITSNNSSIIVTNGVGTIDIATANTPSIVKAAYITAQTSAQTICSYTTGAADSSFQVSAYVNVTALSSNVVQATVSYTDETSTSRTATFFPMGATSATLSTGNSNFPVFGEFRVKASTTITVAVTDTGVGSATYNASATITKLHN